MGPVADFDNGDYNDLIKSRNPSQNTNNMTASSRVQDMVFQQLALYCAPGLQSILDNAQYLLTYQCGRDILVHSKSCNNAGGAGAASISKVCSKTCTSLYNSIANYIKANPSSCTSDVSNTLLSDLRQSCAAQIGARDQSNCVAAVSMESNTCGFPSDSAAINYCSSSNSTDPCCSSVNSSTAPAALSTLAIIGIVAGAIAGIVLLGVIFIVVFAKCKGVGNRRRDQDNRKLDTKYNVLASTQPHMSSSDVMKSPESPIDDYSSNTAVSSGSLYLNNNNTAPNGYFFSNVQGGGVITKRPDTLERVGGMPSSNRNSMSAGNYGTIAMNGAGAVGTGFSLTNRTRPESMLLRRYQVMQDYIPNLPDELDLRVGDVVVLGCVYADGWGQGHNQTTGEDGALPLGLLQPMQ